MCSYVCAVTCVQLRMCSYVCAVTCVQLRMCRCVHVISLLSNQILLLTAPMNISLTFLALF